MKADEIRKRLEIDMPNIRHQEGPEGHVDSKGGPYRTYFLGSSRTVVGDLEPIHILGASESEVAFLAYLYLRTCIEAVRPRIIEWHIDPNISVDTTGFPAPALRFYCMFSMRTYS